MGRGSDQADNRSSYWFESKGNVAMNILWRSRLAVAETAIGDKFDWSVAPMPAGRAGSVGVTVMNPMFMNPNTSHPQQAWKFLSSCFLSRLNG